jgi:hypothetical protein
MQWWSVICSKISLTKICDGSKKIPLPLRKDLLCFGMTTKVVPHKSQAIKALQRNPAFRAIDVMVQFGDQAA